MPRNPLKTFRRKSSANVLELEGQADPSPAQSTFRVLERPATTNNNNNGFDGGSGLQKRLSSGRPLNVKATSSDNLAAYSNRYKISIPYMQDGELTLNRDRGSGGTTHSGSSGYLDNSSASARFSSTSTLPSSLDVEGEELFPARKPLPAAMPDTILEPPPTFMARAGRALSFGTKSLKAPPQSSGSQHTPSQPTSPYNAYPQEDEYGRDRSMTTSSYASTAKPPQLEATLGSTDFGGDFVNMFEGLGGRKQSRDAVPSIPAFPSSARVADGGEMVPPRAASRNAMTPSPTLLERPQMAATKRYSWESRTSVDQLMSASDTGLVSPASDNFPSPAIGAAGKSSMPGLNTMRGYQPVERYMSPDPVDYRAASPGSDAGFLSAQSYRSNRQGSREQSPVFRSELRVPTADQSKRRSDSSSEVDLQSSVRSSSASNGYIRQLAAKNNSRDDLSLADSALASGGTSHDTTPRAKKAELDTPLKTLFDDSPVGPPSRSINPGKQRAVDLTPKKMTRAQFEQARLGPVKSMAQDEKSVDSDDSGEDFDEEDEAERQKQLAVQRRKQEANMAVYRQQMKKVTGGQGIDLPAQRPGLERMSYSAPSGSMSSMQLGAGYAMDAAAGADEDDDVPLGVLQAHGFPSKNRAPSQMPGAGPGYAASAAGDVPGNLPAFARKLPTDPYFGASLVNPMNRENLAYGGGAGSVYGGPGPAPGGGLVGVIAGEERARAARRGSPNPATGGYGPIPLPSNMMPQMPRSDSMGSFAGVPGLPPAMTPQEMATQHQMQQLMQMQAQMMQQMMALQGGQMPMMPMQGPQMQGSPSMANGFAPMQPGMQRPMSMASQGRSMTMSQLPTQWNHENAQQRSNTMGSNLKPPYAGSVYGMGMGPGSQQGYTPSIAPSERSNIGMPTRYRPVSTLDAVADAQNGNMTGRSQTMTSMTFPSVQRTPSPLGAINGNANKKPKTTIRMVDRPKNAPRAASQLKTLPIDEDEEEGWAEMARKKAEMRARRQSKVPIATVSPAFADIYHGLD